MRHDQPSSLPEPPSRGRDVSAKGAQLLRLGAQLAAGTRVVRQPLQRPRLGPRRKLSPLHEPTQVRGRRRAHALGAGRRSPPLHGAGPNRPHAFSLSPQRRRRLRRPRPRRRLRRPRERLRGPQPLFLPARAVPGGIRRGADRDRQPRGAEARPPGHDAPRVRLPRRGSRLQLGAVRARVGDRHRQGRRALPADGPGGPAPGTAGHRSKLRPTPRAAALAGRAGHSRSRRRRGPQAARSRRRSEASSPSCSATTSPAWSGSRAAGSAGSTSSFNRALKLSACAWP